MKNDLPAALTHALDRLMTGRSLAALRARAQAISEAYRAGRASAGVISTLEDALAYAAVRMPATYAAARACLAEAAARAPDFRPATCLDLGAGPGTAGWAATDIFPGITGLTAVERNGALADLARQLAQAGPGPQAECTLIARDLADPTPWPKADLVIASYVLAELTAGARADSVNRAYAATNGLLVLIEPGTPAGHKTILAARTILHEHGARIIAPCPGMVTCPKQDADWCRFTVRLQRSRLHKVTKGADLAYEDEPFIYLVAARPNLDARPAGARVTAPPLLTKAQIGFETCTPTGLSVHVVPTRDKAAFRNLRKADWGDALDDP